MFLFLQVPCKILHVLNGFELIHHVAVIEKNFRQKKCPIMMGKQLPASKRKIRREFNNMVLDIVNWPKQWKNPKCCFKPSTMFYLSRK